MNKEEVLKITKDFLASLPSDEARLAFIDELDICLFCGDMIYCSGVCANDE